MITKRVPDFVTIDLLSDKVDEQHKQLAALRAELSALQAANATLEAERDEARAFVESIVKADDNEMLSACWDEALIAVDRWNYNRPAPDTNRDGFTFADVNSPEFAELLSQVAHHGEHEPPITNRDAGDEREEQ